MVPEMLSTVGTVATLDQLHNVGRAGQPFQGCEATTTSDAQVRCPGQGHIVDMTKDVVRSLVFIPMNISGSNNKMDRILFARPHRASSTLGSSLNYSVIGT